MIAKPGPFPWSCFSAGVFPIYTAEVKVPPARPQVHFLSGPRRSLLPCSPTKTQASLSEVREWDVSTEGATNKREKATRHPSSLQV